MVLTEDEIAKMITNAVTAAMTTMTQQIPTMFQAMMQSQSTSANGSERREGDTSGHGGHGGGNWKKYLDE